MKLTFLEFNEFVSGLTFESSKALSEHFNSNKFIRNRKVDGSLVTEADLNCEIFIRKQIRSRFSNHGIIGEEFNDENSHSQYKWIIDPIDGTFSFTNKVPFFGTLIGFLENNKPAYGSLRMPLINNDFLSGDNEQSFLNNNLITSVPYDGWKNSLILTTDEVRISQSPFKENWNYLKTTGASFRTWGDCYGYYLMCIGKADIMLDVDLKPYDILPLLPIVNGAGLLVIDISIKNNFSSVVVCKPELEGEMKKLFLK